MSTFTTTPRVRAFPYRALAVLVVVVGLAATLFWIFLGDTRASGAASAGDDVILAQEGEDADTEDQAIDMATIEVTYELFLARDPFQSVRPPAPDPAPSDSEPSDPSPVQPTPTDPSPSDPSTSPSPTPPDEGGCRAGTEAVCDGIVVTLDDVGAATADFEVDGVAHTAGPGDVFAERFRLLRIEGECVDVLYADGDVFRLCLGDSVAK